jgi:cytochrome c5
METLLTHAINGFNAMPPRGTCAACSDEEIQAAIDHMLAN